MSILPEQEPKRQFQKAPEGIYNFLEQYDGLQLRIPRKGWSEYDPTLLLIRKEKVCDETGGSCMDFWLNRKEGKDTLDIYGHITDNDQIVFLHKYIIRMEGIFPEEPDVTEVMAEIRAIVPPPD